MKHDRGEVRQRRIDASLARLRDAVEPLSEDELRTMARAATAEQRPLFRPRGRNRPLRLRWSAVAIAVALLVGSGLGFGLGSSVTPDGGAAESPAGLGFLPERGWQVVRSAFEASPERPSFAIASNVPLARLDAKLARRTDWSGYPHRALETLEPHGIVMVASFALRGVHRPSDQSFPRRTLPLRLRDSALGIRPSFVSRRLGWYELRAAINEHNVIVNVYFGTLQPTKASIIAAQRQLDRLVVGSTLPTAHVAERAFPLRPSPQTQTVASAATRVIDRTFSCRPRTFAGIGDLDVYVTPPRDYGSGTTRIGAHLIVRTGAGNPDDTLVVVRPLPSKSQGNAWLSAVASGAAGVYVHSRRCTSSKASLPLSTRGLVGPPIIGYRELDCPVQGRVFVRVRSILRAAVDWRRVDRSFEGARQPVLESKIAIRLHKTGKPIAFMEHDAQGRTKLWYSSGCS